MYFHCEIILSERYYLLAVDAGINNTPERVSEKKPNTKNNIL